MMTEPTTLGTAAISAYLCKDGLQKILGPTADYLGQGLLNFTQRRLENIGQIFQNAETKLGERIQSIGEVPPKVLKAILDEGSFSNDKLAIEYFGGILASSRTELGRDDRGARIAKILDSLSTYQLRTHYLIYSTIRKIFLTQNLRFDIEGRPKMQIFIPLSNYYSAMDFNDKELSQVTQLLGHTFFGLSNDNLIGNFWRYGPQNIIVDLFKEASEDGIICEPSSLGAELFLHAFGQAERPLEFIFNSNFLSTIDGIPQAFSNACPTRAAIPTLIVNL